VSVVASYAVPPSVTTDRAIYAAGEIADIAGVGWPPNEQVTIQIDDACSGTVDVLYATAGADGAIHADYVVPGHGNVDTFQLTATSPTAEAVASTSITNADNSAPFTWDSSSWDTAVPTTSPWVRTDRDDYLPGQVVSIAGSGWAPGSLVALNLIETGPEDFHPPETVHAVANGTGDIYAGYVVQDHDLGQTFVLTATAVANPSMTAQATFTDGGVRTNGLVRSTVLSGNTLYIGGQFTQVGPASGGWLPIDATTGVLVSGFPKVGGAVQSFAPDGAGGWFIGGAFTAVGGVPRLNIAHVLSDNSVSSWNPGANGTVMAVAVNGSTVYAGGAFNNIGGQPRNRIAALDATTGAATPWNPNASGFQIWDLKVSGATVYAAGSFTSIGGQPRNNIAALDALTGLATAWNPNSNSQVSDLALSGTTVYAGGAFTSIGGQTRNRIAALDATTGLATSWNPNANNNNVTALTVSGTTVYAGGDFTSIGGQTRNRIAALDATTGAATLWNPNANGAVIDLNVSGTTVYAAGQFNVIGGQTRNGIAALDAASGSPTAWSPNPGGGQVTAIAVSGTSVYIGGPTFSFGAQPRNRIAALDATTMTLTPWNPGSDGEVNALAVSGNTVYAGGFFTTIGGEVRSRIAALDATTGLAKPWLTFANNTVFALALSGSTLYAGGNFTNLGNRIAALDAVTGNLIFSFNGNANNTVSALAVSGNTVYAGGSFTAIGGLPRNRIAALDATTGSAATWNPDANNTVSALAVSGTSVYAGGSFTAIGGLPRNRIAALDATTGAASSWNPDINGGVFALTMSGTTVYAAGNYDLVQNLPDPHIRAIAAIDVCLNQPDGTACNDPGTQCRNQDTCVAGVCQDNGFKSAATPCTGASQAGACDNDAADHCSGTDNACVDVFQSSTTECRPSTGQCDGAESCTGTSGACPVDVMAIDGTSCNDGDNCTQTDTCQSGTCAGTNYSWSNVLQPVNADGTSVFKLGSTIPTKFRLTGACAGDSSLVADIYFYKVTSSEGPINEATSVSAADTGTVFRYSASGDQYIYNLGTKGLTEGTWHLGIDLRDGTGIRVVSVGLRK
jgi:hypothetical protein